MQNIIKKSNIGIAVQQAIAQLGLEREKTKILACLQRAFQQRYQQFKKSTQTLQGTLKGNYVADNEFPIGEQDKQQYFRSVAYNCKINSTFLFNNNLISSQKKPFTIIEGYSRNDDSKKRAKTNVKKDKDTQSTTSKKQHRQKKSQSLPKNGKPKY